jgi:hypothetical protein
MIVMILGDSLALCGPGVPVRVVMLFASVCWQICPYLRPAGTVYAELGDDIWEV